jgi:hypothetical protein
MGRQAMNKDNYVTLPVAQRLVEKRIMLETDAWWILGFDGKYSLVHCATKVMMSVIKERPGSIPAPSMSELWRELPEGTITLNGIGRELYCSCQGSQILHNVNPCDALAELLIWVRKENP